MAPLADLVDHSSPYFLQEVLRQSVQVEADAASLTIRVSFQHPDPILAATIASLFAQEVINYQFKLSIDTLMKRVADLSLQMEHVGELLDEFADEDLSNERIQIEHAVVKKLYTDLVEQARYAKTQIKLASPSAMILDDAIPPFRAISH